MTEPQNYCPLLGLAADRTVVRNQADAAHRCYAQRPPATPDMAHQQRYCLNADYESCPLFQAADLVDGEAVPEPDVRRARRLPAWTLWVVLALLATVVAVVYLRDMNASRRAAARDALARQQTAAAPTPGELSGQAVATTPAATGGANSTPVATGSRAARYSTPTPEAGGRTLTLAARAGDAGWWTGAEPRGNHLGDSFLYSGYTKGQAFVAAARFELASVPRGAAIRSVELRLMGLKEDRFDPTRGGVWTVQMLAGRSLPDYARSDFQALFNVPAAVTLFPTLAPADLDAGRVNVAALDSSGRAWLEKQVADGETAVIVRIVGPGGGDTLFAWDSGAGPATMGEGPQLVLALGPAPATPPALPTESVLVATETPTPANILTAAANALTATAQATAAPGARAFRYVTPTPSPANLATVQARALLLGLAPIVPHTPTPANEATQQVQWLIATAEAFLTGTPTAPAPGFVTPVFVTPTPAPGNVMTAAANAWTATAVAAAVGTPTPWAYNVVVATVTPPVFVIVNTPRPANGATATGQAAYATAVAMLTGTFTPFPYNAVTATPAGRPLPPATPTAAPNPAPAPTPLVGSACPDPNVQITAPQPGQVVSGQLELSGRALAEGFQRYVVELAPGQLPETGYAQILAGDRPLEGGALGVFALSTLPNGAYTVSLRVETAAGRPPAVCRVVFRVVNP